METWREDAWVEHGVPSAFVQDNHSRSRRGTVRGIHFQTHPGQGKLVRCARGLRPRRRRRPPARLADLRRVGVVRARRRPRPPAVDPDRLRPRLLRALRDGGLRLQVHELLRRGDGVGHPLRRSRRRASSGRTTSSCSTRSAIATRRGWPRWPTRCRSRCERRPLRPEPHRDAAPRATCARRCWRGCSRARPARGSWCGWRTSTRAGCGRGPRRSSSPTWRRSGSTGTGRWSASPRALALLCGGAGRAASGERRLYECYCTRAEIREAASAAHGPLPEGAYPGTCLRLSEARARGAARVGPAAGAAGPRRGGAA